MFIALSSFVVFHVQAKVVIAEQTEKDIAETRSQYIPVAIRTRILFFCTYDLVNISLINTLFMFFTMNRIHMRQHL